MNIQDLDIPNRKYQMDMLKANLDVLRRLWEQYEVMVNQVQKESLGQQIRNLEGYVKAFEFTDS